MGCVGWPSGQLLALKDDLQAQNQQLMRPFGGQWALFLLEWAGKPGGCPHCRRVSQKAYFKELLPLAVIPSDERIYKTQ